jgi:hypothetical protein
LGQSGRVKLSFSHQVRKTRCSAHGKHGKRAKHCTHTVKDGSISFRARRGKHKVRFDGVINSKKTLPPGTYTVTVTAINVYGKSSAPKTLRFTIV